MVKSDIKVSLITVKTESNPQWYLEDLKSPDKTGGQYFLGKCWNSEAEATEWLNRAYMEDILAIRGAK